LGVRAENGEQAKDGQTTVYGARPGAENALHEVDIYLEEDGKDRFEDRVEQRQADADQHHLVPETDANLRCIFHARCHRPRA
jgi:hypothetical protein